MPADVIRVDYDGLAQAARTMDDERQHVLAALRAVRAQVDVLKGGCWEGPAAEVFFAAMLSDTLPALARLTDALGLGADAFELTAAVMADAEERASQVAWGGDAKLALELAAAARLPNAAMGPHEDKHNGATPMKPNGPGSLFPKEGYNTKPDNFSTKPNGDPRPVPPQKVSYNLQGDPPPLTPTPATGPATPPPATPGVTPTPTAPPVSTATPTPTAPLITQPPQQPSAQPTNPAGDILMGGMAMAGVMALGDGPLPVLDVPAAGVALATLVAAGLAGLAYLLAMPHPGPAIHMSESTGGEAATGGEAVPAPTPAPTGYTNGSGYRTNEDGTVVVDPRNLPANPDDLLEHGWRETTHPEAAARGHRTFEGPDGTRIRHDEAKPGEQGEKEEAHYHVHNPSSTGRHDEYLDVDGNPVRRGSPGSHIPADPMRR